MEKFVPLDGLKIELVRDYLRELVQIVAELHQRELVCGPRLSPATVILNSGRLMLLNTLGLRLDPKLNVMGQFRNEHMRWISPEEIQGHRTPAGDQYRLGLLAYFMLTGLPLFDAEEPMKVVMGHLAGPLPDLRELRPELPEGLAPAVERALRKAPEERHPAVEDFGLAVERAFQ